MNRTRFWTDQTEDGSRWGHRHFSGYNDGVVNTIVNAQGDGVCASGQAFLEHEPIFAFRSETSVKVAGPCHDEEFRP